MAQFCFLGYFLAGIRQQLHQTQRVGTGNGARVEFRLLPDQRGHQKWIQLILGRIPLQIRPVRAREEGFPVRPRQRRNIHGKVVRHCFLHHFNPQIELLILLIKTRRLRRDPGAFLFLGGSL